MKNVKEEKEKMEDDGKIPTVFVTSLITDTHLYEMIHKSGVSSFATLRFSDGFIGTATEIEYQGALYVPCRTADIVAFVRLPESVGEYESQAELIDDIKRFIKKWVVIDDDYLTLVCYYILFSWVYDAFFEVPYLRILADLGSGKTRLGVHVLGQLLYKPIPITAASSISSIFRILDLVKGTLIVDEADIDDSDKSSEFVQVINSGYTKNGIVLRTVGIGPMMHSKPFSVFGPKLIISREHFKDQALESRCLPIIMHEARGANIPLVLNGTLYSEGQKLRNKLLKWRLTQFTTAGKNMDMSFTEFDVATRFKQLFLLLSSVVSHEAKDMLRAYAMKIQKESVSRRRETAEGEIVQIIVDALPATEVSCTYISELFNREREKKEERSPQSIGWYARERLGLETVRISSGEEKGRRAVKINLELIHSLAQKYGIQIRESTPEIPFA